VHEVAEFARIRVPEDPNSCEFGYSFPPNTTHAADIHPATIVYNLITGFEVISSSLFYGTVENQASSPHGERHGTRPAINGS
jgi:hypothetical protein